MNDQAHLQVCRTCGYKFNNFFPWGHDGETPSFSYCPCCFTEFGFDDIKLDIIKAKRNKWIESGFKWYEPEKRPSGWEAKKQLENIPKKYL